MEKFNNDILISNISVLMANNSVTQEKMAQALGMSQPNFNHAIHNTGGKRFTIEQIFDIAHYFGVSIDWLMGNKDGSAVTAKSAAEFITRAVLCGAAKLTPYTVEEDNYCADETYAPGTVRKTTVKYWAAYFPSFWNPYEDVVSEEETREKVTEAEAGGNQTPFWSLNAYLDKFVGFYQLLKSRSMDEEDFQTLIAKHLGRIEE